MPIAEEQVGELKRAYQTLGVPLFASALSIKQAYRQLIKRWHPDRYPNGSSSHAEASHMTTLINQAYSEIEHAPLRYYSGDSPRVQQSLKSTYPLASDTPHAARQAMPKTDRLEFWVRFVCGSLLGVFVSSRLLFYVFDRLTIPAAIVVGGVVFGCGFAAARYGDKFWYSILRRWWFWS